MHPPPMTTTSAVDFTSRAYTKNLNFADMKGVKAHRSLKSYKERDVSLPERLLDHNHFEPALAAALVDKRSGLAHNQINDRGGSNHALMPAR